MEPASVVREERRVDPMFTDEECADYFTDSTDLDDTANEQGDKDGRDPDGETQTTATTTTGRKTMPESTGQSDWGRVSTRLQWSKRKSTEGTSV